jgi:hypothetical protein
MNVNSDNKIEILIILKVLSMIINQYYVSYDNFSQKILNRIIIIIFKYNNIDHKLKIR